MRYDGLAPASPSFRSGISSGRMELMATRLKLLAETTAPVEEIEQILRAEHGDPFHILGMHLVELQGKTAVAIRAFLPRAHDAWVVRGPGDAGVGAAPTHPCGRILRGGLPGRAGDFPLSLARGLCRAARVRRSLPLPSRPLRLRPAPSGGRAPTTRPTKNSART